MRPLNNSRLLLPIRGQRKCSTSSNSFILAGLPNHPSSPGVVKMFESCVSTLVEAINVQRQGNVLNIRVGAPWLGVLRRGLNPVRRRHSFSGVFLWDLAFARNWSLASGLCTFECSGRSIYCKFAESLCIASAAYLTPSGHAVSEGSISCYINNHVIYRVARFTYGVKCTREFEHNDPEHQRRRRSAFINPSGKVFLPNGYQAILKKVGGIAIDVPMR